MPQNAANYFCYPKNYGYLIGATTYTIRKILKERNPDAISLYIFYCLQAIRQRTNKIYANDHFSRKGLFMSRYRFRKAKNILLNLKLIQIERRRDEKGRIKKNYLKIKFIRNTKYELPATAGPNIRTTVYPHGGYSPLNAYYNKINAYYIKRKDFKKNENKIFGFPEHIKDILKKKKIIR